MMCSTKERLSSSLSHVPLLPAIDGNHGNLPPSPAHFRGNSMEERITTLELSNKALLEEMMHIHTALRTERELSRKTLSETNQQHIHVQTHWQSSSKELASQNRKLADRLARLELSVSGVEGVIRWVRAGKDKQEIWLKDSFSSLHEHITWLSKKMEVTVSNLNSTLRALEDSTTNKYSKLVSLATTARDNKQAPLEERISQLEKSLFEDQDSTKEMSNIIGQVKEELNALTKTWNKDNKEHKIEIKSLKESLNQLAKEGNSNHQELSTVLKAEIKTRQKTLNEVRSECLEVWELFRESVQALRKGVLFLEERVAIVKKEVQSGQEQQVAYCQEVGKRLQADFNVRLGSLHHHLAERKLDQVMAPGTFLPIISEDHEEQDNMKSPKIFTAQQSTHELSKPSGLTVEQSSELVAQSKLVLRQTEKSHEANKHILEQLQSSLKLSEQLLDNSKQVQLNLEKSQRQARTQTGLTQSHKILKENEFIQTKPSQSKKVFDQVQSTSDQSRQINGQILEQLNLHSDQTKEASQQTQSNLEKTNDVFQQLQVTLETSQTILDQTNGNLNQSANAQFELADASTLHEMEPSETQSNSESVKSTRTPASHRAGSEHEVTNSRPLNHTGSYLEPMVIPEEDLIEQSTTKPSLPTSPVLCTHIDDDSEPGSVPVTDTTIGRQLN